MENTHFFPEQQYIGLSLMAEVHEETGVAYLEIVEEYYPDTGTYLATYYEVAPDGEAEAILGNWYTGDQLQEILFENPA